MKRSTARFKPLLSIPKNASGNIGGPSLEKQAAETVACSKEDKDHDGDEKRHAADHREDRRAVVVHARALLRATAGSSRGTRERRSAISSPTRYTEPVASTAPPRRLAKRCA